MEKRERQIREQETPAQIEAIRKALIEGEKAESATGHRTILEPPFKKD